MTATNEQLHELFTYCHGFAEAMLKDCGEFYPFGGVVNSEGVVEARGVWNGSERPDPREIYSLLAHATKTEARVGEVLAVAAAVNVNIPQQYSPPLPDGIRVKLESANYSRLIYVPYAVHKRGFLHKKIEVQFGEPIPVQAAPEFFVEN